MYSALLISIIIIILIQIIVNDRHGTNLRTSISIFAYLCGQCDLLHISTKPVAALCCNVPLPFTIPPLPQSPTPSLFHSPSLYYLPFIPEASAVFVRHRTLLLFSGLLNCLYAPSPPPPRNPNPPLLWILYPLPHHPVIKSFVLKENQKK